MIEKIKRGFFKAIEPFFPALPSLHPIPSWTTGYITREDSWIGQIRRERWNAAKTSFKIRWYENLRVFIYPDEEISHCLYLEGFYEPNQMNFLEHTLKPGMVFMDVGANSGIFTLFAAKKIGKRGRVISMEPSKREFEKLINLIKLNRLNNVRALPLAAFDQKTLLELKVAKTPHAGHNTLGDFIYSETVKEKAELVQTIGIDELTQQEKINRLDVIKMDIEGSEFQALKGAEGALKKFQPILMIEMMEKSLNTCGSRIDDVWNFLNFLSYSFFVYDTKNGLPLSVAQFPGNVFTDFIAVPNSKLELMSQWKKQ